MSDENRPGKQQLPNLSEDAFGLVFEMSSLGVENLVPTTIEEVSDEIHSRGLDSEESSIIKYLKDTGVLKYKKDGDNG